jgi:hypothetical protein
MSQPRGIDRGQALALAGMLKLVLAQPGLEVEIERRARWLWMRLAELFPYEDTFIDARIAAIAPQEGARRAAA